MDQQKLLFNLRKIRELKGYSQEYMAQQLEISTKTYSRLESGETKLPIMRLDKIVYVLGITVSDVIEFDSSSVFRTKFEN